MGGHWEVERRFLARNDAPAANPIHITQIYLDLKDLRIDEGVLHHRIHGSIADFGAAGNGVEKTLKGDAYAIARLRMSRGKTICGIKGQMINGGRKEYEVQTLFNHNQLRNGLAIIEKTRCLWTGKDGLVWEIDRYIRPELNIILAEVELDHIEQSVIIPDWILEEVTHDPTYTNSELAKLTLSAGGGI